MESPFDPPTGPAAQTHQPSGRRTWRNAAVGVTAGLLAGGAIGLLVAVPSLTSAASDEATGDTIAAVVQDSSDADTGVDSGTDSGVEQTPADETPADQPEAGSRLREQLQPLVEDGTITADQADAVSDFLVANRPERGEGGHRGGGRGAHPGFDGEVLTGLLGIDAETLRTELMDGKTIAEIATAHGVDVQGVIDALVAEAKSHLDLSVQNGRLTQEEADAKLADVTERITEFVNSGLPERGLGRGGRGPGAPADETTPDAPTTEDSATDSASDASATG